MNAKSEPDPVPKSAPGKKVGLKKVSDHTIGTGTIMKIEFGTDFYESHKREGCAVLQLRHGPEPKKSKPDKHGHAPAISEYPRTSRIDIPEAEARKLKIGQTVRIRIEPV